MAAEKKGKTTVVIKKNYISAGHHGGAWKVALADFMTAMMAFFMVMWLLGQSEETKKNISEYFNTPSIIEYNFSQFGALLTLEKLFLDFINAPLEALASFLRPADQVPNVLEFGSANLAQAFLSNELSELAEGGSAFTEIEEDGVRFRLKDTLFFEIGSAKTVSEFPYNTEKLKPILAGLKDAILQIEVQMFQESVADGEKSTAEGVARSRLQILVQRIESMLNDESVEIQGFVQIAKLNDYQGNHRPFGFIVFDIRQKPKRSDGSHYRKLRRVFDGPKSGDVYQDFVRRITSPPREQVANEDQKQ